MFWLNKMVGFVLNPFMLGLLLVVAGVVIGGLRRWRFRVSPGRVACGLKIAGVVWLWFWGSNATTRLLGTRLERPYPPALAADLPTADAILVLGGGICALNAKMIYPELHMGADRAWHAARLYKAGRAPYVMTTGAGSHASDRILLLDLGVPEAAILVENEARNTEEHVALVYRMLKQRYPDKAGKFRVLMVTSAWHMRRALLNFSQGEIEVVAAPADHECLMYASTPLKVVNFFPDAEAFLLNSYIFKEYLGYCLYRVKYLVIATTQWSQLRG